MTYFTIQLLKFCINQCPNVSLLIFLWYLLDLILLMVAVYDNQLFSLSTLLYHFQSMYLTVFPSSKLFSDHQALSLEAGCVDTIVKGPADPLGATKAKE